MKELDKIDRKILALLQENAQWTIQEIGKQINLSKTPTHDRIKRLEKEGIIHKYVTLLDKKKLGNLLVVFCHVTLDKQTRDTFSEFDQTIAQLPEIIECNLVSGNFDYLLKIIVRDMENYNQFYQERLSAIPGILHISSFFAMAEVKNSTVIPMNM